MGFWDKVIRALAPWKQTAALPYGYQYGPEAAEAWTAARTLELYNSNGQLRAILDLIANETAEVRWFATKAVGETSSRSWSRGVPSVRRFLAAQAVTEHNAIRLPSNGPLLSLLADPCDDLTPQQVYALLVVYTLACGEAFLLLHRKGGVVTGFTPIPPSCVFNTPSDEDPFFTVSYESINGRVSPKDLLHFKKPNPLAPLRRGSGVAGANAPQLAAAGDIHKAVRSTMSRGGMPVGMVAIEQGMGGGATGESVDDLKKQWTEQHGRPDQAGRVLFTTGKLTFSSFQTDFRSLQADELAGSLLDQVRSSFGVFAEALASGDPKNAEAARYQLMETVVSPLIEHLRQCLQKWLVPLVEPTAVLDYEDIRPQERERITALMTNPTTASAFTFNEVRALVGFKALPGDEGEQRILPPPGSKPVEDLATAEPAHFAETLPE